MNSYKPNFSELVAKIQWLITNLLARPYCNIFENITVRCKENIPNKNEFPNYIIASNHLSSKDPPFIYYALGHRISCIAKTSLFEKPILSEYLRLINTIPVDRTNFKSSTIKLAKEVLNKPFWRLAIFIEGTRSRIPGQLGKPFSGAMLIAKLSKKPILPIGFRHEMKNGLQQTIIEIGEIYYPDPKEDIEQQSWTCLKKIAKLCKLEMPKQNETETQAASIG